MIYCVNANAAIDKTVIVPGFHLGAIQRPTQVISQPGGKGINVARGLKMLGQTPVVAGWVGGFAGQFIQTGLHAEGIQTDLTPCAAESRTCLSILNPIDSVLTEIYEKGEPLTDAEIQAFLDTFTANIGQYQAVTLSGSIPPGAPADLYGQLSRLAHRAGVPVVLDSSGESLRLGLETGQPDVIKPNAAEFAALLGRPVEGFTAFTQAAREISNRYGVCVVLSLGAEGAVAATLDQTIQACPPPINAISAVGSGDCLVAGFTAGLVGGLPLGKALKQGVAAGAANTLTIGAGRFTLSDFESILESCTLEVLD